MANIPLEDNFTDIIGKAQRGLKLTDEALAAQAQIKVEELTAGKGGENNPAILEKLAKALQVGPQRLVQCARKGWYPQEIQIEGLAQFNTPYEDMTVNAYLVWDPKTREAVAFDTGATSAPMLEFVRKQGLSLKLILLTHTHGDHIADLARLKKETGAPAYVGQNEPTPGAETFAEGKSFKVGSLDIQTRQTTGHSAGAITYVVNGLARPVAVVGDAIFAGSMGGGGVSWSDALSNNRKKILTLPDNTILCPGHGPLTSVGEEKKNNPFYPEFDNK